MSDAGQDGGQSEGQPAERSGLSELERAQKRLAQAKARVQALQARATHQERKLDTRRKVILGGGLIERARRGDEGARRLLRAILDGLERPVDRKAFEGWTMEGGEE